ncbi:MAG: V-type ATP synthase subunit D [Tissierellia bacterium]|nr:V-type ATP synthase subunit D [Tissierellia bacterium]
MARIKVNPTRMQMSILRGRLKTATRGHKLLKDKQDELMRRFIELIRENKRLRSQVEEELKDSFNDFLLASAMMSPEMLRQALAIPKQQVRVNVERKNIMSVNIPVMDFEYSKDVEQGDIYPYGYAQTSAELDDAIDKLQEVMSRLLELAAMEKAGQLMAGEIEKTRRRVNALEYRTIPDLQETIKYNRMKLDENERATITRLMKVKEIIAKET